MTYFKSLRGFESLGKVRARAGRALGWSIDRDLEAKEVGSSCSRGLGDALESMLQVEADCLFSLVVCTQEDGYRLVFLLSPILDLLDKGFDQHRC